VIAPLAFIIEHLVGHEDVLPEIVISTVAATVLVTLRFAMLQHERMQAQAALAVSERRYRELFWQADQARSTLAAQTTSCGSSTASRTT
jgi:hypothetical protein